MGRSLLAAASVALLLAACSRGAPPAPAATSPAAEANAVLPAPLAAATPMPALPRVDPEPMRPLLPPPVP